MMIQVASNIVQLYNMSRAHNVIEIHNSSYMAYILNIQIPTCQIQKNHSNSIAFLKLPSRMDNMLYLLH